MKSLSKCAMIVLSAVVLVACSGCAVALIAGGAAAGAGGVIWYEGALRTTIGYTMSDVDDAAADSLRKAGDGVVTDTGGSLDRELETRLAGGDKIIIKLHAASSTATDVSIRIGLMGDRERSQAILDDILVRLKAPKI
jgi:hypothetical protein